MYLRTDDGGARAARLGEAFGDLDKGGMAVGESDAAKLLKILEGRSSYQPYLKRAMANRATTVPKNFLRIVTSVSTQVPKRLQRLFVTSGGRMVGGTIDRWTRTIYMVPAPGLRLDTRLEYALHECVHLFAHPQAPTQQDCAAPCIGTFQREFGTGFGEGLTQVITEDIMASQSISQYYRDRPYENFAAVMRQVVKCFGRDVLARAYFFGETQALRTLMDARWGTNWHAVAGATTAGNQERALASIKQLEAAYKKRLEDLIRNSPKGDFPTPTRERMIAGALAQEYRPMYVRVHSGFGDPAPADIPLKQKAPPFLVFSRIGPFAWNKAALTPQLKQQIKRVADYVRSRLNTSQPIGVVRLVGHTDGSGNDGVNVKFGNYRAEVVRDELRAQLRDVLHRVLIEAGNESPGKSQPVGDNRTAAGRALNRRVDVYIAPPIPPAEPWPQGPTIKNTTITDPDPDWDKFRFKRGMPDPLGGKSVREFLIDKCRDKFKKGTCETIVDKAISLGCKGVEALIDRLGNVGSAQKAEIKRRCEEAARKSI